MHRFASYCRQHTYALCVAASGVAIGGLPGCGTADPATDQTATTEQGLSAGDNGSQDIDCPSELPAGLVPPAGNKLKLALHVVEGTQDYACVNGAFTLQNPEAILRNGQSRDDARHFFGAPGSPVFVSERDSSEVDLAKIGAAPAPVVNAVAWLLLQTVSVAVAANGQPGVFSDVTFVQRLNTRGGDPPAATCGAADVGKIVKVPYSADYFFYEKGTGRTCH